MRQCHRAGTAFNQQMVMFRLHYLKLQKLFLLVHGIRVSSLFTNMSGKATIYTIAKIAGVSTTTVSKILNGRGNISQETVQRVTALIKKYNYIPQQRRNRGNAVGVVTFLTNRRPLSSPFVSGLINGICRKAYELGHDVTLLDGERFEKFSSEELLCYYTSNSLLGLLGINLVGTAPLYKRVMQAKLPMVMLANPEGNVVSVSTRNYESTQEMIDYIICCGHVRIAYIGLVTGKFAVHEMRKKAYCDVLTQKGIPLRHELVVDLPNAEIQTVKNALLRLLSRSEPPTALFVASEELDSTCSILKQMGYRIPEDISVAGMAFTPDHIAGCDIEFSSIVQPLEEIGEQGVQLLQDMLHGIKCESIQLDNSIVYGDTVRKI